MSVNKLRRLKIDVITQANTLILIYERIRAGGGHLL